MPGALAVDEAAHLRVPAPRLVAEVDPGLQQLLDAHLRHRRSPLFVCESRVGPRDPGPSTGGRPGRAAGSYAPPRGTVIPAAEGQSVRGSSASRAALSRAREVGRQRRRHVDAAPVIGVLERRAGSNAGTGATGRTAPACRSRDRRRPDARWPEGAHGSGACARSPGARAVGHCAASCLLDREVRARSRGSSVSIETVVRERRSRPRAASIVPERDGGRPVDEREVLALQLARRQQPLQARGAPPHSARRPAAPTCRGPGGGRSPRAWGRPARAGAAQGLGQRALRVPASRVHDHAGRLVDDQECVVLEGHPEAGSLHGARDVLAALGRRVGARR